MTFDTDQTVREIAFRYPATVKVFESLGIDYCCGGKRPLKEACERAGVSLERAGELLSSVEREASAGEEDGWTDRPLRDLTAHIVARHHAFIREEAPRLENLLAKVVGRHGQAHPELRSIQETFAALAQELAAHMMKEERILFPVFDSMEARPPHGAVGACFGSVEFPIARMLADHDDAGVLTARIRELTADFVVPDDACPSYRGLYDGLAGFERDLHRHIHLENNILFPRAIEMEKQLAGADHVGR